MTWWAKTHYLTLKSKVKVTGRSLWYMTHRLMVMRPHTKYQGPTSHYGMWHIALWSCTHKPNIIDLSRKTKMLWPGQENTIQKTIIWPWGQRSRSHEGHYGMRHTALWSCTHIPNIIDLSGKTKKLWSEQASLRRSRRSGSGRKNQIKTICLPSFEGET